MVSICTKRSFNFTNEESSQNQFSAKRRCAPDFVLPTTPYGCREVLYSTVHPRNPGSL